MRFFTGPDGREMVELTAKGYRAAQERQRIQETSVTWAMREVKNAEQWARDCLEEERRLGRRLNYLYGLAASLGATEEQLQGTSRTALDRVRQALKRNSEDPEIQARLAAAVTRVDEELVELATLRS